NLVSEEREYDNVIDYADKNINRLNKALSIARNTLKDYRQKMIDKSKQLLRGRNTEIKENDLVYIKKEESDTERGLSHKLDDQSLGPFQVKEIDKNKGNIQVQAAPNSNSKGLHC